VILRLFGPLLDTVATLGAGLDWKTSLQELTSERGLGVPSYLITSTGPDHDREFTAAAMVADTEYGTGVGRTKKEAEQKAASAAWSALDALDRTGDDAVGAPPAAQRRGGRSDAGERCMTPRDL
jgi:ribonuclease-3